MNAKTLTELGRVGAVAPSPCGRWLAVEVARIARDESRYVSDLWRVELAGDAPPRQLTRGESSDTAPRFRRDGALGFLSSRPSPDDDEEAGRAQVWLLPPAGGEPYCLTDEPLGAIDFRFAAAADRLVVLSPVLAGVPAAEQRSEADARRRRGPSAIRFTDTPVRHWDHWLGRAGRQLFACDEEGRGRRALTPEADRELIDFQFGLGWDLSADGARIVTEWWGIADDRLPEARLELIDLESAERSTLVAEARSAFVSPRFDAGGERVTCVLERRPGERWTNPALALVEPGGSWRRLAAELDAVVHEPQFSDEDTVLFTAEVAGHVPAYAVAVSSGELRRLTPESAGGSHASLARSGERIVGVRHRLVHPPEPFDIPAEGGEPRLLASVSGWGESDGSALARVEVRHTTAADGAEIPWFWLRPSTARPRIPALLWIHGGPMSQWSDGWHWRWNPMVMVGAGYAVAMPNPRGSTGLGEAFTNGVWNNRWGAECYTDLMAVTDDLAATEGVAADRIGAMGGSFGGYMANWIGGKTDRFACLVSHAGIYHFPAFQGTTDGPPFFTLALGGHPREAPELSRYSPHRVIEGFSTPVLILHGEKDYRVPISEALILFEDLRSRGCPAELVVFPDENHWILGPHNARTWYGEVLRFLGEHLGEKETS